MRKINFAFQIGLVFCLAAVSAQAASMVEFKGEPVKTIKGVKVYPQAVAHLPSGDVTLSLSGAGIGQKQKFLLTFDAYVAANYVQDVKSLRAAQTPLEGIAKQPIKIMKLTMLWTLSQGDITAAFQEGLLRNNIDPNEEPVATVFDQFDTGMSAGQSAVMIGAPESDSLERLVIELPTKTISEKGKDLALDFWTIWFGKGDKYIDALRPQLIGKGK